MLNNIKKLFGKKEEPVVEAPVKPKRVRKPKAEPVVEAPVKKSRAKKKGTIPQAPVNAAKEAADLAKEPWVEILSMELDPDDIGNGAFELDWNDVFVAKLVRAGYQGKTDQDIVDRWFQTICRNILAENYEQEQADPVQRERANNRRDLGDGRTEFS